MRMLAISDIHGMYDKFIELLELIKYDPADDKLILLGDYVDRGPRSVRTVQKVMELVANGAIALIGNHERMLLDAYIEMNQCGDNHCLYTHFQNGGKSTWEQLSLLQKEERVRLIRSIYDLPLIHETEEYVFVHAGIDPVASLDTQNSETLLWARDEFIYNDRFPIPNKTVIFGHTPTRNMNGGKDLIWHGNGKIGIDCGAVFGGKLACLELPSMKECYV